MERVNPYRDPTLLERVLRRVVGRRREVRAIIAALAAGKNILLEGPPGTSKSTILRAIAEESKVPFFIIEGSADLTPQKLVGIFNPSKVLSEGFKPEFFEPGPLVKAMMEGGILYIEEFNRMSEDAMNTLIRAMDEREIAIPRYGTVRAKPTFRVICAMNPYDDVGTSRISRAILDRFCRLRLDYQSRNEEIEIVRLRTGSSDLRLITLAVDLARATRRHPALKMGSSVRGAIDMVLIAEELKKLRGGRLCFDDLLDAAIMAMSSKIWINDPEVRPEDVIRELLMKLLMKHDVGLESFEVTNEGENSDNSKLPKEAEVYNLRGDQAGDHLAPETIQRLKDLAKIAPRRVSFQLSKKPEVIISLLKKGISKANIDILDLYARVSEFLRRDLRTLAQKYASLLILKIAAQASMGARARGLVAGRFDWDSDDINLDLTMEEFVNDGTPTLDKIMVNKRDRRRRCFALIIDRSLSMAGYKMVLAALTAAMLAYAAGSYDGYAVLAFNTEVSFLKRVFECVRPEKLVDEILSLRAFGYTDIARALEEAYRELLSAGARRIIGILITDGEWTAGENPLKVAPLFDNLYVLGVPSKWRGFARAIAERGGGRYVLIRDLSQVPQAVLEILRYTP